MYQAATGLLEQKYDPYYLYRQRDILGGKDNIGYCLPGKECVYNIVMIEERHFIFGLGCGANSKFIRENLTLTNVSTPKDVCLYLDRQEDIKYRRDAELAKLFRK
jgi:oxygen-independent coproporphyrinogen-3 oxidase